MSFEERTAAVASPGDMYREACGLILIGDRMCEIYVALADHFREKWGRRPEEVVVEACSMAARVAESE